MLILRLLLCTLFALGGAVEAMAIAYSAPSPAEASIETSHFWIDVKGGDFPMPNSPKGEESRIAPMHCSGAVSLGYLIRNKTEREVDWPIRFSQLTELPRTFRSARIHYLRNLVVLIISNQAP